MENLLSEQVVFDLKHLNFVGSLGIKDFVDNLEIMRQRSGAGVKFCGLSSEFRRVFESTSGMNDHIFESRERAIQSFALSKTPISISEV
jgi:anti-anti-sigma regulatory factor